MNKKQKQQNEQTAQHNNPKVNRRDVKRITLADRFLTSESQVGTDIPADEKWKLKVGSQCNRLLDLAAALKDSKTTADRQIAADLSSIIERVAEFEDLQEK